jgi:hypothetical protein
VTRDRNPERGVAMFIVMIVVIGLTTVGLLAVYETMGETKATSYGVDSDAALYCAEAGLAKARPMIGGNYAAWAAILDGDPSNDPSWYPITGDLDVPADGKSDFTVTIRDDDDEPVGTPNDPTKDNDLSVYVISTCTRYPETPRQVTELIHYKGGGAGYRNQSGQGAGNTGNTN